MYSSASSILRTVYCTTCINYIFIILPPKDTQIKDVPRYVNRGYPSWDTPGPKVKKKLPMIYGSINKTIERKQETEQRNRKTNIGLIISCGTKTSMISTVQYSTVQYSTVQYSTVQYSTVQYSTVQYSTVQYSTVQYSTVQYSTVQYSTVQYSTVQYSTVQYSTVQTHTSHRDSCTEYNIL